MKPIIKSWKTTTLGVIGIIVVIANVAKALLENEPVDWGLVIPAVTAGLTGLFARDNNKSSESVGIK